MGIFGNAFGWPHLVVILVIVLLIFGAPKLPGLARSLGQSMRIFRGEMKTMKDENGNVVPAAPADSAQTNNASADGSTDSTGTSSKPKS